MLYRWIAAAAVLVLTVGAHAQSAAPLGETVQTQTGTIHGTPRDPTGVLVFKGIPYAAPPVGDLRWQAPQPRPPWEGVRDATQVGNRCLVNVPENGLGGRVAEVPQSEDCLYLNVWTAARTADERRPVMVWIHGGGFQFGTARDPRTDGDGLARKGAIVVSMNYRLGVFGFFAHPQLRNDGRLAANFGIQDQIAALRWVRANIPTFGGDPGNVTIFGESSGSQAVSLLMASPVAKGLFQKAIGESGSSLQTLPSVTEMSLRGAAFAGALGGRTIAALRAMPAAQISTANAWDFVGGEPMIFAPAVDGFVIPAELDDIFAHGAQNDVPLLAGYNKREDFPFPNERLPHNTAAEFRAAAEHVFGADKMPTFTSLYPCDTDAAATNSANDLLGDIRQRAESWHWLSLQAKTGKAPVYGYRFSYQSAYSPAASHVAEVAFVFGNLVPQFFAPKAPPADAADRTFSDQLMSYWVNFATNGDPNGPGLAHWPAFRGSQDLMQMQEDGSFAGKPPSEQEIARFRFLDGYLISASSGQI